MHIRKKGRELAILQAVDDLSRMAEVDRASLQPQEQWGEDLTEQQLYERKQILRWRQPDQIAYNQERARNIFSVILQYLESIYEDEKGSLRTTEMQRGVQAIMLLAGEAVQKLDRLAQQNGQERMSFADLKEYQDLQQFYLTKIVQEFEEILDVEERWGEEIAAAEGASETERQGLQSLEDVRQDRNYELFHLRKADGKPFFTRSLLRHLGLVSNLEELVGDPTGEDLFLRIQAIQDRDLHHSAKEVLHLVSPYIEEYYAGALKHKSVPFVSALNKSLMALMLAANQRNLLLSTTGKCCMDYYADFHFYLRQALASKEYQKFISKPPEHADKFSRCLIHLAHALCTSFFLRVSSREEMIAFIRQLIDRGSSDVETEIATPMKSPQSLWNSLLDDDESIRHELKRFPSGPMKKVVQVFRDEQTLSGFNPLTQGNLLSVLYTIANSEFNLTCLRLPSPTVQANIQNADVAEEFYGFLRSIESSDAHQRHLLINLQERTSWQEHARCVALEEIQKSEEFADSIVVITIPKNADFYLQVGPYLETNDAKQFIAQFKEQIASGEQCGYFLPATVPHGNLKHFIDESMKAIHTLFFGGKELLVRKNRLDFIEIFYLFFILKMVEMFKPDTVSFTCKDAIDTGAAASAEMFAFLRMMNNSKNWSQEERDFLLWMLYTPALIFRQRPIDGQRLSRMISALETINAELEAHHDSVIATCSKLFTTPFFHELRVREFGK